MELNIEDYKTLHAFAVERAKYALWFEDKALPDSVLQKWKEDEESGFWALEQLTQQMKKHIAFINLYGVALRKCRTNASPCDFCKKHPPRGLFLANAAREFDVEECDCPEPICKHKLNNEYQKIFDELSHISPPDLKLPRRCGHCKEPGHDVRKCSKLPPDDPKRKSKQKK